MKKTKKNLTTNKPKVLYKYATAEVGLKILETQTIRFSNPITFNDPYDCCMPIIFKNAKNLDNSFFINLNKKIREIVNLDEETIIKLDNELQNLNDDNNALSICPDKYLNIILQPLKEDMRVLSLSKNNNNLLMWGHYAQNHKGTAIGFNTNYKFLRNLIEIKYSKTIPKLRNALINDLYLISIDALKELRMLFHTKSIDWKYEQEYRFEIGLNHLYRQFVLNPNYITLYPQFFEEIKNKKDFIHPYFTSECINSVYLGINMDIDNENNIINLIKNKYPHTKIYKAFLSEFEFKVDFKEIIK